uniref:TIP41-like protein n=1 Tax=Clastoptera arizonana TaxID=38151 RepID=A0A1B6C2K4_9HEMI
MAGNVKNPVDFDKLPVNSGEHTFEDWDIKFKQSHILSSKCSGPPVCSEDKGLYCPFCVYNRELKMSHLPDMVFPNNILSIAHKTGCSIKFIALDALKHVKNKNLHLKIACSNVWKESRQDSGLIEQEVQPFDWTFSTDYSGTLGGPWKCEDTQLRIDMERLKQKEQILFFHELTLFEDELHDNGIASSSVKMRVMPSGFFILLRFFLRVDGVLLKINDTRFYHDFTTDFILREYTSREGKVCELEIPIPAMTDPNICSPMVPVVYSKYEKLSIMSSSQNNT